MLENTFEVQPASIFFYSLITYIDNNAHSKHLPSSFFKLIIDFIDFLLASALGKGIYDEPLWFILRKVTASYLQPRSSNCKFLNPRLQIIGLLVV